MGVVRLADVRIRVMPGNPRTGCGGAVQMLPLAVLSHQPLNMEFGVVTGLDNGFSVGQDSSRAGIW